MYILYSFMSNAKKFVTLYPESQVTGIQRLSGYHYDAGD